MREIDVILTHIPVPNYKKSGVILKKFVAIVLIKFSISIKIRERAM